MTFTVNPILCCDAYKLAHKNMYPAGTEYVYSNFTPRSGRHYNSFGKIKPDEVVVFGLTGMLSEMNTLFNTQFFAQNKQIVVNEFKHAAAPFMGLAPADVDASHIAALHDLGYLPIEVRALDEGTLCPFKVPVLTIINTKPEFFWLTNYLETWLSAEGWKAMTSATTAHLMKELLVGWALRTGGDVGFVDWQGHDFSMRGMGGWHDAARSGAGHATSFFGSDSIPAAQYLRQYYRGDEEPILLGSIAASEHSVMTMGGTEGEYEILDRILFDVCPTGNVSVVCDGYDYWKVITEYLPSRKDRILARGVDSLGMAKVVVRPDSGAPEHIIAGYRTWDEDSLGNLHDWDLNDAGYEVIKRNNKYYMLDAVFDSYDMSFMKFNATQEIPAHEAKGSIECLWEIFGGTVTDKGYKVLHGRIGLIYGDSITLDLADEICERLSEKGFASTNCVYGCGSYLFNFCTRDTLGFAMKATYGVVNGEGREIFKDPKTDPGKKSAKGLLRVQRNEHGVITVYDQQTQEEASTGLLVLVYKDGVFDSDWLDNNTIGKIRERLKIKTN